MRSKLLSYRFIVTALFLVFSILSNHEAKACHAASADMYVTYIGPGIDGCTGTTSYDYEITVNVYLGCQTCGLDLTNGSDNVYIFSPTLGASSQQTITVVDVNGPGSEPDTVSSLCPFAIDSNSCRHLNDPNLNFYANNYPAYRKRVLKGTCNLPTPQYDWTFAYAISGAGRSQYQNLPPTFCSGLLWVEVVLNNVTRYNNSSPRFTSNPLPYICLNQPTTYLNNPFDPDGDSMQVYQQAPYNNITYNTPPYPTTQCTFPGNPPAAPATQPATLSDPIYSAASNPYTLNPNTGAATFTPVGTIGAYILAFRAEDYERGSGVLLSKTFRDVQVAVLGCNSPAPNIDSLKPSLSVVDGAVVPVLDDQGLRSGNAIVTCPGNNMTFSLTSKGTKGHNLYMYANNDALTGSTFNVTNAGSDSIVGTFSWTPTLADVGERNLVITSADSTCKAGQPIVLYSYTSVYLKIIAGLNAGKDLPTCNLNPPRRRLFVKGYGNLDLKVKWTDVGGGPAIGIDNDTIPTPTVQAPGGTQYVVYSPELTGQCKVRDTVGLINDTSNSIDIFPQTDKFVMCRPGYLQLDVVTKGGGPVNNAKCDTLPKFTCDVPDSITLYGSTVFGTGISYDTLGTSAPIFAGDVPSYRFQFLIRKDELKEAGLRAGSIKSLSFEIAENKTDPAFQYGDFKIFMGCVDPSTVTKLDKTKGFISGLVQVYATNGITLENGVHNFVLNHSYNWDTTKNLVIGICYANNPTLLGPCGPNGNGFPGLLKYMPTTYPATIYLPAPDPTTMDVCGANTIGSIKELQTRPVFGMTFCDAPGNPFDFTWYPGTLLSDSTIRQPLTYVPRTTTYQVSAYGKNGCKIADTMQVYIPVHNFSVWPADTSICYGQTVPLEVRNGNDYQWFEYEEGQYKPSFKSLSCDYCANPVAKPLKSTRYKIMVGDEVFCYDTIDAYIEVRPLPQVHILTPDTVVKYGHSVQLLVNGAKMYNWTPVSSLNNPNISYPLATPTEPTMYVVSGISATGCYSYDTVRVGIDYRDNLNIPTAFSPNGDGKNDVFRVTNITFQKIVEFRVFNRWGQEVYNGGGDSGAGWDGNWKGVPQEIGDYSYLVRVSSPDGLVETYKGNVTLIR